MSTEYRFIFLISSWIILYTKTCVRPEKSICVTTNQQPNPLK